MGEIRRLFVPFGELKPDGKLFNNDGLVEASGVVPVYGNYIAAQTWVTAGDEPSSEPYGLHTHFGGGSTWYVYVGTATKLYQGSSAFVLTDKTRAAGGAYGAGGTGGEAGWQSASFGDAVIMTDYVDDPQLLTSPAAANFVKLAQSGSGNPGMDPKAKFVYPLRGNLHLANLNLASGFDTLPSGANPTVVAWSQTENVRQYGSFNVTPQLIGTGYQPLNYDFGHITGAIGGDYGIITLQRGIVREDGPPYTFRPIVVGQGLRFPNSMVRFDNDVYFWGPSGPSVLRGGEGPVESLGNDKIGRTLIDNSTGFSSARSIYSGIAVRHVGVGIDPVSGLVYWTFTSTGGQAASRTGDLCVIYNVNDQRFSFMDNTTVFSESGPFFPGILFMQNRPDLGDPWAPGRDLVGLITYIDQALGVHYKLSTPQYAAVTPPLQWATEINLTRAYQQIDPNLTTRIRRVRPIYSRTSSGAASSITCSINSKNKPYDAPASTASTTTDEHGWIATPGAYMADFHQVGFTISGSGPQQIVELEGYEIEYETGGAYSA